MRSSRAFLLIFTLFAAHVCHAQTSTVKVSNVRRVFHNGEHNAFTDLVAFGDRYYLTFRSCPDGHAVSPTAAIQIMMSEDLQSWKPVYRFSIPQRDTRDPHFLVFRDKLFVYSGTWHCDETKMQSKKFDMNAHLGYAVSTADGVQWSTPQMLEGTYGHYIWRAACVGDKAYLCGRRKHEFDARYRRAGPAIESVMLESDDGIVWKTHSLFQETQGDETAFLFDESQHVIGIGRRGNDHAQLLRAAPPYVQWERVDLDRYIGGPLLARWNERWIVGGRRQTTAGPRTSLCWLSGNQLEEFAELPSDGDNSYPGFVALSPTRAVVSWYSSHETDEHDKTMTAIYMADLSLEEPLDVALPKRTQVNFMSTFDRSTQTAYLSGPPAAPGASVPLVVSLHSWSADLEQRQPELETLVAERGWFCLQPNFRGANDDPLACASQAAQQDILDAVKWTTTNYPIDSKRIYLTGDSGGGHMTMMLAAKYPTAWKAASAWVGISDLSSWHTLHHEDRYGAMLRQVCGGAPGDSPEVDEQYRMRSPLTYLSNASTIPLDIASGIHDGHAGSVPIRHSLDAFNAIAVAVGSMLISADEIKQLSVDHGRLRMPMETDEQFDASFGRQIYLRRTAGNSRVSIFEGGHEGIAAAAMAWFDAHP